MANCVLPQRAPVLIASHNVGKLEEIRELLDGIGQSVLSAVALGLKSPAETQTSFAGNALLKAQTASRETGLVALADDSGLCVDVLKDEPGIYTARWAREAGGWSAAHRAMNEKLQSMQAWEDTVTARLHCALALAWPDGRHAVATGAVTGNLTWPARGLHGGGFDAMFVPDGQDVTFAQMEPAQKALVDARAIAFQNLLSQINQNPISPTEQTASEEGRIAHV